MQVKLIPNEDMQRMLSQHTLGRKIKYIVCEPNQMDILKANAKRASNLRSSKTRIECTNSGKVYESIRDASDALGLDAGAISKVVNNKQSSVKGFHFKKTIKDVS